MKIAVCIKQVPVLFRLRFDYENKTIVREGVPLEVNAFDMLAVDRAAERRTRSEARWSPSLWGLRRLATPWSNAWPWAPAGPFT